MIEMDLTSTLQVINNIAGLVCIKKLIKDALDMMERCPQSFIVVDFVLDVDSHVREVEALSHNEFFARRWWQLECLDYRPEIELCLLSIEDLIERVKSSERILIDIRPYKQFEECHLKGSFFMN